MLDGKLKVRKYSVTAVPSVELIAGLAIPERLIRQSKSTFSSMLLVLQPSCCVAPLSTTQQTAIQPSSQGMTLALAFSCGQTGRGD